MQNKLLATLLVTTFLSTNAVAQTIPEINADYLTSLTGDNVTWKISEAGEENTVGIDGKYYKFTYNNTGNYTETSTRIEDTLVTSDVTDVVFSGISLSLRGGAICNYNEDNSSININADFIDNYAKGSGGAIYNYGTIGDITGNFVGNYANGGSYD